MLWHLRESASGKMLLPGPCPQAVRHFLCWNVPMHVLFVCTHTESCMHLFLCLSTAFANVSDWNEVPLSQNFVPLYFLLLKSLIIIILSFVVCCAFITWICRVICSEQIGSLLVFNVGHYSDF